MPVQTAVGNPVQFSEEFRREVTAQIASEQSSEPDTSSVTLIHQNEFKIFLPPATVVPPSTVEATETPRIGRSAFSAEEVLVPEFPPASWIALVWLIGACVIAIRILVGRITFFLFRRRFRPLDDADLQERVHKLANRVGVRGTIHLAESRRLTGPVAFGSLKRTIALPSDFLREFNPAQQDAMLAHELAHLAAGDSAWQLFSDCVVALLWWHPLVWWMKRQLLTAAESAADEASRLVANGPNALAECLVALGGRLTQPKSPGWVGIEGNGFRSGLARRINRLITLQGSSWRRPRLLWSRLAKGIGPLGLAAFAIAGTAWVEPSEYNSGRSVL